jgi:Putative transmembrane protein (PGPGW)
MHTNSLLLKAVIFGVAWASVSVLATLTARRTLLRLPADALHSARGRKVTLRENAFGLVLIGLGTVLLFLPGPGTVLIVAGLLACEFPGRHTLLRWILSRARVLTEVNAFRMRRGRAPLEAPTAVTPENNSSGVS